MKRPVAHLTRPSPILASLGGAIGTVLLGAAIHLGPLAGLPYPDLPRLLGGLFTGSPAIALALGWALFWLAGWVALSTPLGALWPLLPGQPRGLLGGAAKGLLWGAALWVLLGLLLPAFAALGRLGPAPADPGFFGLAGGAGMALSLALGQLLYGLAVALVMAMAQGTGVLETLGWPGYGVAGMGAEGEEGQA